MKIERHAGLHPDSKQTVAPVTNWGSTHRSFATALREQRQRLGHADKDSQQRADTRPVKSRPRGTTERDQPVRPLASIAMDPARSCADRPHESLAAAGFDETKGIDRPLASRWARTLAAHEAQCIEVVHAATGSRFLLSRQDGTWLLAFQSRVSPQEAADIARQLRSLFAERGLGPLDVVKL